MLEVSPWACACCGTSVTTDGARSTRVGLHVQERDGLGPMCLECLISGAPYQPEFPATLMALLLMAVFVAIVHAVLS